MLTVIPGEPVEYFSSNSICKTDMDNTSLQEIIVTKFLNSVKCSGIPHHRFFLKIGIPITLIRNIDQFTGLCNDTRLRTTLWGHKHWARGINSPDEYETF